MPHLPIEAYQIGWVCPLYSELTAARAMLDEEHEGLKSQPVQDGNFYVLGRVHGHNVVLACLQPGPYSSMTAAKVVNAMLGTFSDLRFGLLVGIGGGIPNLERKIDIRLGDVVVSLPEKVHGGLIQYDIGKFLKDGRFERKGFLQPPPAVLLNALSNLQAKHEVEASQMPELLADAFKRFPGLEEAGYGPPGSEKDHLRCFHSENSTNDNQCKQCVEGTVRRPSRAGQHPVVHYGIIASGNQVTKNAIIRDQLNEDLGAICVEMEAAGMMADFPCIVIRGICDYADAHKNDIWHKYAAMTAAAYAKELLSVIRPAPFSYATEAAGTIHTAEAKVAFTRVSDMRDDLFEGGQWELQYTESGLQPHPDTLGSNQTQNQNSIIKQQNLEIGPPTDSGYASLDANKQQSEDDDSWSIKTDNETIALEEDLKYDLASAFVTESLNELNRIVSRNQRSVDFLMSSLPELLKNLSVDLKTLAKSEIERKAAIFIRHHRRLITSQFQYFVDSYRLNESEMDYDSGKIPTDLLSVQEKLDFWNVSPPDGGVEDSASDNNEEESQYPEYFPESRQFIVGSLGFRKFLLTIDSYTSFTPREGTKLDVIRRDVLNATNTQPATAGSIKHAFLEVDWDPAAFFHFIIPSGASDSVSDFLSLTSCAGEIQAATLGEYMQQLWPITGEKTLNALRTALESQLTRNTNNFAQIQYKLSKQTAITILQIEPEVKLEVTGFEHELLEIVEHFAWLGSACRLSPYEVEGCLSTAEMSTQTKTDGILFKLAFRTTRIDLSIFEGKQFQAPNCWFLMFKNPVIVHNFPIRARSNGEKGLEIPLHIMTQLGMTDQATFFDGGMLLKGFSTMFIPIRHVKDSIQWHFVCNTDGSRISYWKADEANPDRRNLSDITFSTLKSSRHFVGWTAYAILQAGGANIDYEAIRYTGSNFTKPGCALEKVTISGSLHIGAGMTFGKWNKNSPLYLNRETCYTRRIHFARSIYVVLYDTHDRRGWLVDGASALLHLVCAQLSSKRISSSPLFKLQDFEHSIHKRGPDVALNALLLEKNLKLPIFEEWDEEVYLIGENEKLETKKRKVSWNLKNLIEETYGILEQIHEHQVKQLATPGLGLRATDRDMLEGFGFRDIVEGDNPLRPRVTMLKSSGRGWVDLTRNLRAITLMARGLGELIVPDHRFRNSCPNWAFVPKRHDYLASCTWLLREICDKGGNEDSNPLELFDGIYWHKGGNLFENCDDCHKKTLSSQCDRVQVLLPPSLGHKTHPKPFRDIGGGVIFGRSSRYNWRWPRAGQPSQMNTGDSDSSSDEEHDSGIGTSISAA